MVKERGVLPWERKRKIGTKKRIKLYIGIYRVGVSHGRKAAGQ